jgi:hypothetical protein
VTSSPGPAALEEYVSGAIIVVRGQKALLDADLARLYGVETKALNQAVKRQRDRFPEDFMFRLSAEEFGDLRSQSVTSRQWGGRRRPPLAFTEQGVAMLSGILNSPRAIRVNIAIMRAFVRLRRMLLENEQLALKIREMEDKYDRQFAIVFDAILDMADHSERPQRRIGFRDG